MRTLLALMLCASFTNVFSLELPKDTIDKYIIDDVAIENFDGTQLENKTISKYIIAYKDFGNVVEKNHVIITGQQMKVQSDIQESTQMKDYKGLIIVNGKEIKNCDISKINKKDVISLFMIEPGSKAAETYGEKGKYGVMIINTTTASNNKIAKSFYIDGKKVDESEMNKLMPDNIASISVLKQENAIYVETKQGKNTK